MIYIILICLTIGIIFSAYRIYKIGKKNNKIADQMHSALGVIIKTHYTLKWLEKNDPMALRQATAAFEKYFDEYDKS